MDGWSSPAFEFVDIEIIDHKKEDEKSLEKWDCDLCSLFFLSEEKLQDHKKNHLLRKELSVHCRYCNKTLSSTEESKESYLNKKCDTCEYKCSKCPQRFLRHSSLLNHEKNHSSCKKKILNSDATNNGTLASKKRVTKKRRADQIIQGEIEISIDAIKKEAGRFNKSNVSPKKKKKMLSDEAVSLKQAKKSNVETLSDSKKMSKRSSRGGNKQIEEKGSKIKSNQNHVMSNSLLNVKTPSTQANPNNENVVNYKPFSCHVCGDTFASENGLLVHIKSHGESAASTFKCKFCGDQFEDIYKMQYHLAICPLAEDELESSFKQSIPPKYLMKNASNSESTLFQPRKRGRPRKSDKDDTMNDVNSKNTKSLSTTAKAKFRKNNTPKEFQKTSGSLSTSLRSKSAQANRKKALDVVGTELNFEGKHDHIDGNDQYVKHGEDYLEASNDLLNESSDTVGDRKVHACPFPHCNFKFSRETAMLCHLRNHNDDFDDTLKCHKCGIPYDDIHSLRIHLNTCKGLQDEKDDDLNDPGYSDDSVDKTFLKKTRGTFVCKQCGKGHNSQESLNSHLCQNNTALLKKMFCCNICKEKFKTEKEENDHMITHARKEAGYPCMKCFHIYRTKDDLSRHQQGCKTTMLVRCNKCYETFCDHAKYTSFSNENDSRCVNCNKKFIKSTDIIICSDCRTVISNRLETSKENIPNERFICLICSIKFSSNDLLKLHEYNQHKDQHVSCQICSRKFSGKTYLKNHVYNKHVNKLSVFRCQICQSTSNDANALTDHIMDHILNNNVNKENSDFTNISVVSTDINSKLIEKETVKNNPRDLIKDKVQKSLSSKITNLNTSRAIRKSFYREKVSILKELEISCPICFKGYIEGSHLKLHILNKHVKHLSSYVCVLCDDSKLSKKELTGHLMTHAQLAKVENSPHYFEKNIERFIPSHDKSSLNFEHGNSDDQFLNTSQNEQFDSKNKMFYDETGLIASTKETTNKNETINPAFNNSVYLSQTERTITESVGITRMFVEQSIYKHVNLREMTNQNSLISEAFSHESNKNQVKNSCNEEENPHLLNTNLHLSSNDGKPCDTNAVKKRYWEILEDCERDTVDPRLSKPPTKNLIPHKQQSHNANKKCEFQKRTVISNDYECQNDLSLCSIEKWLVEVSYIPFPVNETVDCDNTSNEQRLNSLEKSVKLEIDQDKEIINNVQTKPRKKLSCTSCSEKFHTRQALQKHIAYHIGTC